MKCGDVEVLISDYLDQELLGEVCRQIEEHLAQCPHCRVEVSTLKRTIELYHRIPSCDVPGTVESRLFKVLNLDPTR
jgi:anti-sigma factor RsiW